MSTPGGATPGSAKKGTPARKSKDPTDIWAGNPYPSGHPKNAEIAQTYKREQRKTLLSRFSDSKVKMRLADYDKEKVTMEAVAAASPHREFGEGKDIAVAPVTEVKQTFEAKSKCVAIIQGGATLWSGEDGATVVIRNGFTGEEKYRLRMISSQDEDKDEKEEVTVERLFPLENHMFIGLSNGTVKIYDTLVVTIVREDFSHSAAVKFFQQLPTGAVVSVATDGHIVLYEDLRQDEEGNGVFFPVLREADLEATPTSLSVFENQIFVGLSDGTIRILDSSDLGPVTRLTVADGSAITAVLRAEGVLVAGTDKGAVKIYKINERTKEYPTTISKELNIHEGKAISSFLYDGNIQRMWSGDASGVLKSWDVRADTDFVVRNTVTVGSAIADISSQCNMDAVRVWTLASNGINFAWWSEFSRTEFEMQAAIDDMQKIIEEDEAQLAKQKTDIDNINRIDEHRRKQCIECLAGFTSLGLRQVVYWKWRKWMKLREHLKKREMFAHSLAATTEKGLQRIYYLKLYSLWQTNKLQRQKLGIAHNLLCGTKKGIQRVYWRKLVQYKNKEKQRLKRSQMAEALMSNSNQGLLRVAYKKFCGFHDRTKFRRKRLQVAQNLLRNSDVGLLRLYYFKFLANHTAVQVTKKRGALIDALGRTTTVGLLRIYYAKLIRNIANAKTLRRRKNATEFLALNTDRGLLGLYYAKLVALNDAGKEGRKQKQIEANKAELAELEEKFKAMEGRIERTKQLHELESNRQEIERKKEERLRRIQELEKSIEDLKHKIKNKEDYEKNQADVTAALVETMSQLKCRALNFDGDYSLISKTVDRAAAVDRGAVRLFLSAHMDVKRTIVSALGEQPKKTGEDSDLTYTWGKTDTSVRAAVSKFPPHTFSVILEAMKKMVIAFDILKPENLQDIETDDEIVQNATGLITMFDYIVEQKSKKKAR